MNRKYFFFYYSFLFLALLFSGDADHLVFNRVAIAPNEAEMFSIYNPTNDQKNLNSYYITDGINPDSNTELYTNFPFLEGDSQFIVASGNTSYPDSEFIPAGCGTLTNIVYSGTISNISMRYYTGDEGFGEPVDVNFIDCTIDCSEDLCSENPESNSIYLKNDGSIWYNFDDNNRGFRLEIIGAELTSISGGDTENYFFEVNKSWTERFNDFLINFPLFSTINPGETIYVSINDNTTFESYYNFSPDYNVEELLVYDDIPYNPSDVLGDTQESLIMFYWNDEEGLLIKDVDYMLWGGPTFAIDKTNIPGYNPDDSPDEQSYLPPINEHYSYMRNEDAGYCCIEFGESELNGNGFTEHNETSELLYSQNPDVEFSWHIKLNPEKNIGCTDQNANNYDVNAHLDLYDECEYTYGCMESAFKFSHDGCVINATLPTLLNEYHIYHKWAEYIIGYSEINLLGESPYRAPFPSSLSGDVLLELDGDITEECLTDFIFLDSDASTLSYEWADESFECSLNIDVCLYLENNNLIYKTESQFFTSFNFDPNATSDYSQSIDPGNSSCISNTISELYYRPISDVLTNQLNSGDPIVISGQIVEFAQLSDNFWKIVIRDKEGYQVDVTGSGWEIVDSPLNYLVNPYNEETHIVSINGEVDYYAPYDAWQIATENIYEIDDYDQLYYLGEFQPEDVENKITSAKIVTAPYVLIPTRGERLDFYYSFPGNSRVIIRVYSIDGKFITTIIDKYYEQAGSYKRYEDLSDWDGRDHLGQIVSPGTYLFHIEASNFQTGHTTTDISPVVIGVDR